MKISKFIFGILPIAVLCLTACGSKPNMSFEEALDTITHSELKEIMNDADNYKQTFNISTELHVPEDNVDANISFSTESKQNTKDSQGESVITLNVEASGDGDTGRETIKIDGDAIIRFLSNAIYFKLNSLDMSGPEDFLEDIDFDAVESVKNQRFSLALTDEMLNELYNEMPEGFDLEEIYSEENLKKAEEDLKKFEKDLKNSFINEGSFVYSGIYPEFNGYNARKFSIDKKKAFNAFAEYIRTFVPEEYMDDYNEELKEIDLDEIFEDFPLINFEGYFVITSKDRVQIVIENLSIEDDYSNVKINGAFGKDRYELAVNEDGDEVFILSAKLNKAHYDVTMKVADKEYLTGTITPKKSFGKIGTEFDLTINFDDGYDKINIPLRGGRSWEKISKFNVEAPEDSKNLMEDILGDDFIGSNSQEISKNIKFQGNHATYMTAPIIGAGIMAAALMPRMQAAQGRARDVARKTALSQIQSAIVTSQGDKGKWPGMDAATKGITVNDIEKELIEAGMSSIPTDPESYNMNYGLGDNYKSNPAMGEYLYLVTKRNGTDNGGFVLMAKTEVEGGSNWVVCENDNGLNKGYITNNSDIAKIQLCNTMTKGNSCGINEGNCTYTDEDELRYIVIY